MNVEEADMIRFPNREHLPLSNDLITLMAGEVPEDPSMVSFMSLCCVCYKRRCVHKYPR